MENSGLQSQSDIFAFDTTGGISVEEQQEILDKINSLSVEKGIVLYAEGQNSAKKKGFLFPLIVNFAALLVLALGFTVLWFTFSRDDQDIREGSAVLNLTERRLIQEIRRETNRQLLEKENEINDILLRLAEAGTEYRELQLPLASLTGAQAERAERLLQLQEEYRNTLSILQSEKTTILEDSRLREFELRTQTEKRLTDVSTQIEHNGNGYAVVAEELVRLSTVQDRAAAVEALFGGYYAGLDSQLRQGQNDEALLTIAAMRNFLDSPLFLTSRSLEGIKQNQLAAISVLERSISAQEGLTLSIGGGAVDHQLAEAEKRMREQENIISALMSEGSNQGSIAAAYEQTITELRSAGTIQQQQIARLTDINNQLQGSMRELTQERNELKQRMDVLPQVIEQAIEVPAIQDQLGPAARQALRQIIVEAIQEAAR